MMRSLWIAKTGLDAQQTQLDVISNNLANVSTNGYKRSRAVFEDLLYQTMRPAGTQTTQQNQVPAGLTLGTGSRPVATVRNYAQGALQQTSSSFDLSVNGAGFFQVQLPDGTLAYTRDGSFQIDSQGQLVTNNGLVIDPGIVVPEGVKEVAIGQDGVVTATVAGQTQPVQLGQLQLATFINPPGLQPLGQNLFGETAASGVPVVNVPGLNGAGLINQGYVEASNVNVVEELVGMIQTQRAYEINSRAITTADQMLQRISQL
ncbi:MAG: flagellar basal-body rod protein FlgG [Bordetella sp. SCN 67-23]|uniref:Flagellar basal-body rod protein FlgG n=1 Tax=Pigmentiphaga daeguensis TaxID=414049 RepID=A0ABP3L9T9_9BURK|nr:MULTISPECIES: flagellar basal-body rod protein FlgG [unclassified Pigmentiphaga]MBN9476628.1 flagellar basal-body rod protein FlgG [Burkholderiales bacterium]ODS73394.1 MAG: flagellar basal-body rod protein FlgG [Bordetella sp. SCN 67-23]OJW88364.1 MAG: flagellar basal-body rod protein FlgG [Burkholderiales bacterium 67-32]AZG09543.1 flagellar basal-body rod protein FlgG [Pigmentiphaga sp. H8]MDH2237640.1 flagellar basal-body rod protein FlgG [Pigmentiphaga sp. GD03639]